MLNLNTGLRVQKPEFAFWDEHLINFLFASIPSTFKRIIDHLNIRDTLTLNVAVCAIRIKETELTVLGIIKGKSIHFATLRGFREGQ